MTKSSVISGFYKLPPKERLAIIKDFAGLTDEETKLLENTGSFTDGCSRPHGRKRHWRFP